MRAWIGISTTLLLFLSSYMGAANPADERWGDGGLPTFYQWDKALPPRPGVMLRHESIPLEAGFSSAARAERVLYTSTDGIGGNRHISVSGVVYFPKGTPPAGGWPIIAWAHGTTGVADVCAPSWRGNSTERQNYLNTWLAHGYAVVASDYQGLGQPGPHPYLHPRSEGFSVLDSVRAALSQYHGELANKVIAMGQSQGSGAAIAAAQLAPGYAPDLNYLGTVATGLTPALDHADGAPQLSLPATYSYEDSEEAAFAAIYLLGTVRSFHPELKPDDYFSPAGKGLENVALHSCFPEAGAYASEHRLTLGKIYARSVATLEQEAGSRISFTSSRVPTPVFTGTGLDDRLMEPSRQYNFIASMCHEGTPVAWHVYPGMTHMTAVNGSLKDSLPFVRRLFAGESISSNCAALSSSPWAEATARHYSR